ncbi:MAG: sulfotransferase [Pseudomonadota bacterium]
MSPETRGRRQGPDFLCIGAPKCGTSWLHRQMTQHRQVWLPLVKELHYFDSRYPLPVAGTKAGSRNGVVGLFRGYPRDKILRSFGKALKDLNPAQLAWAVRYFGGAQDDNWYLRIFDRPAGMRSGDFTTAYCALSAEAVAHARRLAPDVRVVFLMRNPMDRAWSHARMLVPKLLGKPLADVSEAEFTTYLSHPAAQLRGRYLNTLETWESQFPAEQIFTGFFDDIASRPEQLLQSIYTFLELDASPENLPPDVRKPVNVGNRRVPRAVPPAIHALLADLYRNDIKALQARFGGVTETWA